MQPRLDAAGYARWVEDPRSAGGTRTRRCRGARQTGAVWRIEAGAVHGASRGGHWPATVAELGARARAARRTSGSGKWESVRERPCSGSTCEPWAPGSPPRCCRRRDAYSRGSSSHPGGNRSRADVREEEARAYREEAAALEAQRRLAHRMTVGDTAVRPNESRGSVTLFPLEDTFSEAAKTLSIRHRARRSRLRRAAVLRVDLRPAEDDAAAAGRSQMGGTPELPEELSWPHVEKGPMCCGCSSTSKPSRRCPTQCSGPAGGFWSSLAPVTIPMHRRFGSSGRGRDLPAPASHLPDHRRLRGLSMASRIGTPSSQPRHRTPELVDYSLVGDALLEYRDHDLVKRLLDEFGHPAKLCILPSRP